MWTVDSPQQFLPFSESRKAINMSIVAGYQNFQWFKNYSDVTVLERKWYTSLFLALFHLALVLMESSPGQRTDLLFHRVTFSLMRKLNIRNQPTSYRYSDKPDCLIVGQVRWISLQITLVVTNFGMFNFLPWYMACLNAEVPEGNLNRIVGLLYLSATASCSKAQFMRHAE